MIQSFLSRGAEDLFEGRNTKEARRTCPRDLWAVARRKLDQLDSAERLQDLATLREQTGGPVGKPCGQA